MTALVEIAQFLLEHADLIDDIRRALTGGVSKEDLRKMIRDAMVAASDAAMKKELGG